MRARRSSERARKRVARADAVGHWLTEWRSIGVGRGQPARQAIVGGFEGCEKSSHYSPDPRQDQCVQGVLERARQKWMGRSRTARNGCRNYSWRRHKLQFLRRRFGAERVDESFSESQAFRTVVRGRSTFGQGCPTDTPGLRGVGRVDQRSELRPQECSRIRQQWGPSHSWELC